LPAGRALAQHACQRGPPDQDGDAVQAERSGGGRAEGGRGQARGDREVAHRRGEQQGGAGRASGADAERTAGQRRGEEEQDQGGRDGGVAGGQVDLGGDERHQGGHGHHRRHRSD